MAGNCCICGKKMGIFEGNPISIDNKMNSYYMCGSCSPKIKLLKHGDIDTYKEFESIISNISDAALKEYLKEIAKTPEEKEIFNYDKKKADEIAAQEQMKKINEFEKAFKDNEHLIMLTTGYNFEGYNITQYKNIISGECVLGTGFLSEFGAAISDLLGSTSGMFSEKLKTAKMASIYQLKKECFLAEGNAIIGVDFDYITFQNNMIGVVANGTAVIAEKV